MIATASGRLKLWLPILLLLAAIAVPLINPIGYVGGAADDVHYLDAARCWAAHGPCLPTDHWATRWPAIAPMAGFIRLFGESRLAVGLGPFMAFIACVLLLFAIARLWFDDLVAGLAALLFASIPVVSQSAFQPSVDATELAAQLGALWLAIIAYRSQSRGLAIAAGIVAAISVQARDTSILFCAIAGLAWLGLDRQRRPVLLWALAGFAAAEAIEMAIYAAVTGDPLFRYRLALHHVALPSSALPPGFDTSRSPLFNPAYIAAWQRESGVHWWWGIDPWINLVAAPRTAFLFAATLAAAALGWRSCPRAWRHTLARLAGFVLLASAGLIYALAIDPKPRMFFALTAAAAMVLAAIAVPAWRAGRPVPAVIAALVIVFGLRSFSQMVDPRLFERQAKSWIAEHPGDIEIDRNTRTTLTLIPDARALPPEGSGRPLRLTGSDKGCAEFQLRVVGKVGEQGTGVLCLLRAQG